MNQETTEDISEDQPSPDTELVEILTEQLIGNTPDFLDRTDFSDEDL